MFRAMLWMSWDFGARFGEMGRRAGRGIGEKLV